MDNRASDTVPDSEWLRLRQWSAGYDEGFARIIPWVGPVDFSDRGEWLAGFAQGLKDRKAADAEFP